MSRMLSLAKKGRHKRALISRCAKFLDLVNARTPNIPIIALAAVLILIAVRQLGEFKLQIWQIMLLGAMAVLAFGQTTLAYAAYAINLDVMVFLGGMFVIGEAMSESGYLIHFFNKLFCRAKNLDQLLSSYSLLPWAFFRPAPE